METPDEVKIAIANAILKHVMKHVGNSDAVKVAESNKGWLVPSVEEVYKVFEQYGNPEQRELLRLRKRLSGE